MEVPAFSKNGKGFCFRVKEAPDLGIVFAANPRFAGWAERADAGAQSLAGFAQNPEKFSILGVASGIAGFDPGDSQFVEGADYGKFVLYGKIYPFALGAVAEGGVEYFNESFWQVPTPWR
jgi:hypothetical protein